MAFLLLLVLDLLIVFADRSYAEDFRSCIEEEAIEVLEGLRETEEQVEEEENLLHSTLHPDYRSLPFAPRLMGRHLFFASYFGASPLALGWMLSPRI